MRSLPAHPSLHQATEPQGLDEIRKQAEAGVEAGIAS
jgi:hypothetical protein